MTSQQPHIPAARKANGYRTPERNAQLKRELWNTNVEPGKYYGRFLSDGHFYYLYGSWMGDSVALHREESREGDPFARAYVLPSGAWWIKSLIYGEATNGLNHLQDNFLAYVSSHPDLKA